VGKEEERTKGKLWTKNFTIITIGSFISAIGGAAMGLAFSLVVFDQTSSTWLAAIVNVSWIVPGIVLPILMGPYIDKANKRKLIYKLDYVNSLVYLLFYLFLKEFGFVYSGYIIFSLIDGCIGSVYNLTYISFYPDLINEGSTQKGFAVSSLVYPLAISIVTPIASVVYTKYGIELLILSESLLLSICATFETRIKTDFVKQLKDGTKFSQRLKIYFEDFKDAYRYLKKEKGLRSLYLYNAFNAGDYEGKSLMIIAYFQTSSTLTAVMYSLLISAETIGRVFGGFFHYFVKIPEKARLKLTMAVYTFYNLFDGILLFVAFPIMIVLRFICGVFGINTATLRQAAVMHYIKEDYRAKVSGFFEVLVAISGLVAQLIIGALGEFLDYRVVIVILSSIMMLMIYFLIFKNRKKIQPIYEGYE